MDESVTPVQAEAEDIETVDIEYAGNTYTFPVDIADVDGDVAEALESNRLTIGLKGLMTPDDWKRFKATKPKVRDYGALIDLWAKAAGLSSGPE